MRPGLSLAYRLLVAAYVGAIILFSYRTGMTLVAKSLGAMLLIGMVLRILASGRRPTVPMTYRIWLGWFLWALLLTPQAIDIKVAGLKAFSLLQIIPISFVVSNYLLWNKNTRFYQLAIIGAALISCAMVLITPRMFTDIDGRVYGPLGNANAFGGMLVAALVMVLSALAEDRRLLRKILWTIAAGILFAMILDTGSRQALLGALIAAAVTLTVYLLRARVRLQSIVIVFSIVAILLPIGSSIVSESGFWFRTEKALNTLKSGDVSEADTSLAGRLWLYQRAAEIAIENPVFGVGLDNFGNAKAVNSGSRIGTYSHSNYMEILVSTGFPGFIAYFSIYWLWLRALYRYRKLIYYPAHFGQYTRALVLATTFMVLDLTSVSYDGKFQWLLFAWIIAELEIMRGAVARIQEQESKPETSTPDAPEAEVKAAEASGRN